MIWTGFVNGFPTGVAVGVLTGLGEYLDGSVRAGIIVGLLLAAFSFKLKLLLLAIQTKMGRTIAARINNKMAKPFLFFIKLIINKIIAPRKDPAAR